MSCGIWRSGLQAAVLHLVDDALVLLHSLPDLDLAAAADDADAERGKDIVGYVRVWRWEDDQRSACTMGREQDARL